MNHIENFNVIRIVSIIWQCGRAYLIFTWHRGSHLLTTSNFNPSMDKKSWAQQSVGLIYLSTAVVEVWEWISNFITHIFLDVITYPGWD